MAPHSKYSTKSEENNDSKEVMSMIILQQSISSNLMTGFSWNFRELVAESFLRN
jgi:hypothetical protein